MGRDTHTSRLIATVILIIITLSVAFSGHWFGGVFWGLIALAVAYPFIAHGSLSYPSGKGEIVNVFYTAPPGSVVP